MPNISMAIQPSTTYLCLSKPTKSICLVLSGILDASWYVIFSTIAYESLGSVLNSKKNLLSYRAIMEMEKNKCAHGQENSSKISNIYPLALKKLFDRQMVEWWVCAVLWLGRNHLPLLYLMSTLDGGCVNAKWKWSEWSQFLLIPLCFIVNAAKILNCLK